MADSIDQRHLLRGPFLPSVYVAAPELLPARPAPAPASTPQRTLPTSPALRLLGLAVLALLVHGYHPYAEDGGIYVAGIKLRLNPELYPASAAFVRPYLRLSVFSNWNAWLVRALHLPLDVVLFVTYVATTWLLLYSCLLLARRCFARSEAHWGAVMLVTLCLTVPVAGTSLFLMDPYVTSRSITTPLTLLAACACLDRRLGRVVACLVVVGLFHPLMGIYATGFVLLLEAAWRRSRAGLAGLAAAAVSLGAVVQLSQRHVLEGAAHHAAVLTRYYYFLSMWQWYEWVGLVAPLVLLALYYRRRSVELATARHRADETLALGSIAIGAIAIALCLLFARPESGSHLVATLQPMRSFLFVYYCMFLLLGGLLGQFWLKHVAWRWVLAVCALGGLMYGVERSTYPALVQVELPWVETRNPWAEAFLWVRMHTPVDAVVALDADYIQAKGEDAQGFRAIAERSSLADFSKDGGSAAIFPALAEKWMVEHTADTGLSDMSDAERERRLAPFHVHWLILQQRATTALVCPYGNERVKVCELP
jgi:hypothetical protein